MKQSLGDMGPRFYSDSGGWRTCLSLLKMIVLHFDSQLHYFHSILLGSQPDFIHTALLLLTQT